MFCDKCGNQLNENEKVCPNCGNAIEEVQPNVGFTGEQPQTQPLHLSSLKVCLMLSRHSRLKRKLIY